MEVIHMERTAGTLKPKRQKKKKGFCSFYTKGEEIFNMTSHIVGAVLGIVALILCIVFAAIK